MDTAAAIMQMLATGPKLTRQLATALNRQPESVCEPCRRLARHGLVHSVEGMHGLTGKGAKILESGLPLPCARKGHAARSNGGTLRQRAWNIMRMRDTFTVDDLLRSLCDGSEKSAENNLANYCLALRRAGFLGVTARTGSYFLKTGHGPKAPAYNRGEKCVTDRNTGKTVMIKEK